jgi:predicted glutamine amidotransferase
MVFHFRQATEGTIKPSNCHPFPITKDRILSSSLKCETDYAIAHNGIIYDYGVYAQKNWQFNNNADITDTLMFIEDYLCKIGGETIANNEGVRKLIESHTESKFAMLSRYGISTIGKFIEDKGLLYSNGTYVEYKPIPVKSYKPDKTLLDYSGYEDIESYNPIEQCDICGEYVPIEYITDIDNLYICDSCNKAMNNMASSRQPVYLTDNSHSKYWQSLYSK